jgi:hypothetical protein
MRSNKGNLSRGRERRGADNQLVVDAGVFLVWVVLCATVLWLETWCGFALGWLTAMAGDVTRAAAGTMTASAAIRRLNEVITSVCSGWVVRARAG